MDLTIDSDQARTSDADLAALDQPAVLASFTQSTARGAGAMSESVFLLRGMRCAACARSIENALAALPGVQSARVQFGSERARVIWDPAATRASTLAQAIRAAGYEALPARSIQAEDQRARDARMALWRLLVAGFCMMQVMMYAVPAYYINPGDISADMDKLLRWAGWTLTLPVLLFSCQPFFKSAWHDLNNRRIGMDLPVALGIAITFIAGTAATFDPGGPFGGELYFDSLTMFVSFLLAGRFLEQRLRGKTAGAVDGILQRLPQTVTRLGATDGADQTVTVGELRVGDVVRVRAGQAFPGDGVLINCAAQVDESLLTGESRALRRSEGEAVLAGSYNLAGPVTVHLTQIGAQTRFAHIAALMQNAADDKPRIAQLADRIAGPFLIVVLLAAAAAAAAWWWLYPAQAPALPLKIAVAILIVTCPCALSLATPAAMLAAAGALAERGVLVQRLQSIERLAQADVFVFDKTGTLTSDGFALAEISTRAGVTKERALAWAIALAAQSLHPVSRALAALKESVGLIPEIANIREIAGLGLTGVSAHHGPVRLGSAAHVGLECTEKTDAALGSQLVCYLADSQGIMASFFFDEQIKPDAHSTIKRLQAAGNQVWLLSGDRDAAVARVANALSIDLAWSEQSPEDKLAHIKAAQVRGLRIVMVGDGLNDGPVIAQADVSFALGQAAPLSQAKADFIALSGNPGDIAACYALARRTIANVRQNLAWAALYNAVCIPLAIGGLMPPWLAGLGMAASSLAVVANALRLKRGRG